MADPHLTSGERLQVYAAIFRMNRSFHLILCRLFELGNSKTFNSKRLAELRGLTQEMQAEINYYFVENLEGIESKDWFHFGKVRIARDHRLNPERPAFRRKPRKE